MRIKLIWVSYHMVSDPLLFVMIEGRRPLTKRTTNIFRKLVWGNLESNLRFIGVFRWFPTPKYLQTDHWELWSYFFFLFDPRIMVLLILSFTYKDIFDDSKHPSFIDLSFTIVQKQYPLGFVLLTNAPIMLNPFGNYQ